MGRSFQGLSLEQWVSTWIKIILTRDTNGNSSYITDLNLKAQTVMFVEENIKNIFTALR